MGKLREFAKKHKMVLVSTATAVLGFVGGLVFDAALKGSQKSSPIPVVRPDYYNTIDEAIDAFKAKGETTKNAVLFDAFGEKYGVYDEAGLIGDKK